MDHDSCPKRDDDRSDAGRLTHYLLSFLCLPGILASVIFLLSAGFTGEPELGIGAAAFFFLLTQTLLVGFGPLRGSGWQAPLFVFGFAAFIAASAVAGHQDSPGAAALTYAVVAAALGALGFLPFRRLFAGVVPPKAVDLLTLFAAVASPTPLLILLTCGTTLAAGITLAAWSLFWLFGHRWSIRSSA